MNTVKQVAVQKIPEAEYVGPVYWEGKGIDETYFPSMYALRVTCSNNNEPLPLEVFACTETFLTLSSRDVFDSIASELHDDALDGLSAKAHDALESFLDVWNKAFGNEVVTWHKDDTRMVVLRVDETPEPLDYTPRERRLLKERDEALLRLAAAEGK